MNSRRHWHPAVWPSRLIVLILSALTVFPLLFAMMTSLKTTREFQISIWSLPRRLAWSNYSAAWIDSQLKDYVSNSVTVVACTIAGIVLFASLAGYALARLNVPGAEWLMTIILIPTLFPSESILMPFYIQLSKMKMLGQAYTLIIPFIGWGVPMATFMLRNFFRSIPSEMIEAAKVDGAGEISVFSRIIVPLMLPAILTVATLNLGWWGELLWTSVSMSSSTFRTIPLGMLSFQSQTGTDWGPMCAGICIVVIPLLALFLFSQKYFVQGVTSGAVKG